MPEILAHPCREVLLTLLGSNTTIKPTPCKVTLPPCLSSDNLHQTTVALPPDTTADTYLVLLYLIFLFRTELFRKEKKRGVFFFLKVRDWKS